MARALDGARLAERTLDGARLAERAAETSADGPVTATASRAMVIPVAVHPIDVLHLVETGMRDRRATGTAQGAMGTVQGATVTVPGATDRIDVAGVSRDRPDVTANVAANSTANAPGARAGSGARALRVRGAPVIRGRQRDGHRAADRVARARGLPAARRVLVLRARGAVVHPPAIGAAAMALVVAIVCGLVGERRREVTVMRAMPNANSPKRSCVPARCVPCALGTRIPNSRRM
ncbi:hypothetical protein OSC27_03525 [Microbacterium sp. STN6]|uniref:hypothetical protein n=1 Tax=Microbacterium sp. STN6 TaxID=2995588 RepID=UPI002260E114|nr:hypothetical protein [Microbacterium sp. STN6]MCX7521345.1 hypothetical protein [Microbacterium sp. STN6]